jgi:hypothetical protein
MICVHHGCRYLVERARIRRGDTGHTVWQEGAHRLGEDPWRPDKCVHSKGWAGHRTTRYGIGSTIPCPTTGPRLSWCGKFWKISFPAKSTSCSQVWHLTYIFGFIILSTGNWARYMRWQSHHSLVKNWRCRASFRFLAFFSSKCYLSHLGALANLGCVRLPLEPSKIFRVLPPLKNRSLIRGRIRGLFGAGPLKFRCFGF